MDDLHHVPHGSLQEFDELPGRSDLDGGVQLVQDRSRRAGPLVGLSIAKESSCAKPSIDLLPQRPEVAAGSGGNKPHRADDIVVTIRRGGHHLSQLLTAQRRDQLGDRRFRAAAATRSHSLLSAV